MGGAAASHVPGGLSTKTGRWHRHGDSGAGHARPLTTTTTTTTTTFLTSPASARVAVVTNAAATATPAPAKPTTATVATTTTAASTFSVSASTTSTATAVKSQGPKATSSLSPEAAAEMEEDMLMSVFAMEGGLAFDQAYLGEQQGESQAAEEANQPKRLQRQQESHQQHEEKRVTDHAATALVPNGIKDTAASDTVALSAGGGTVRGRGRSGSGSQGLRKRARRAKALRTRRTGRTLQSDSLDELYNMLTTLTPEGEQHQGIAGSADRAGRIPNQYDWRLLATESAAGQGVREDPVTSRSSAASTDIPLPHVNDDDSNHNHYSDRSVISQYDSTASDEATDGADYENDANVDAAYHAYASDAIQDVYEDSASFWLKYALNDMFSSSSSSSSSSSNEWAAGNDDNDDGDHVAAKHKEALTRLFNRDPNTFWLLYDEVIEERLSKSAIPKADTPLETSTSSYKLEAASVGTIVAASGTVSASVDQPRSSSSSSAAAAATAAAAAGAAAAGGEGSTSADKEAALELWQALYDMFGLGPVGAQHEAMFIELYEKKPEVFWRVHDEMVAGQRAVHDANTKVSPTAITTSTTTTATGALTTAGGSSNSDRNSKTLVAVTGSGPIASSVGPQRQQQDQQAIQQQVVTAKPQDQKATDALTSAGVMASMQQQADRLELWQALYDMFGEEPLGAQREALYAELYDNNRAAFWLLHDELTAQRLGDFYTSDEEWGEDSVEDLYYYDGVGAETGLVSDRGIGPLSDLSGDYAVKEPSIQPSAAVALFVDFPERLEHADDDLANVDVNGSADRADGIAAGAAKGAMETAGAAVDMGREDRSPEEQHEDRLDYEVTWGALTSAEYDIGMTLYDDDNDAAVTDRLWDYLDMVEKPMMLEAEEDFLRDLAYAAAGNDYSSSLPALPQGTGGQQQQKQQQPQQQPPKQQGTDHLSNGAGTGNSGVAGPVGPVGAVVQGQPEHASVITHTTTTTTTTTALATSAGSAAAASAAVATSTTTTIAALSSSAAASTTAAAAATHSDTAASTSSHPNDLTQSYLIRSRAVFQQALSHWLHSDGAARYASQRQTQPTAGAAASSADGLPGESSVTEGTVSHRAELLDRAAALLHLHLGATDDADTAGSSAAANHQDSADVGSPHQLLDQHVVALIDEKQTLMARRDREQNQPQQPALKSQQETVQPASYKSYDGLYDADARAAAAALSGGVVRAAIVSQASDKDRVTVMLLATGVLVLISLTLVVFIAAYVGSHKVTWSGWGPNSRRRRVASRRHDAGWASLDAPRAGTRSSSWLKVLRGLPGLSGRGSGGAGRGVQGIMGGICVGETSRLGGGGKLWLQTVKKEIAAAERPAPDVRQRDSCAGGVHPEAMEGGSRAGLDRTSAATAAAHALLAHLRPPPAWFHPTASSETSGLAAAGAVYGLRMPLLRTRPRDVDSALNSPTSWRSSGGSSFTSGGGAAAIRDGGSPDSAPVSSRRMARGAWPAPQLQQQQKRQPLSARAHGVHVSPFAAGGPMGRHPEAPTGAFWDDSEEPDGLVVSRSAIIVRPAGCWYGNDGDCTPRRRTRRFAEINGEGRMGVAMGGAAGTTSSRIGGAGGDMSLYVAPAPVSYGAVPVSVASPLR